MVSVYRARAMVTGSGPAGIWALAKKVLVIWAPAKSYFFFFLRGRPGLWLPDAGPAWKLPGAIFPAGPGLSIIFHTDFSP